MSQIPQPIYGVYFDLETGGFRFNQPIIQAAFVAVNVSMEVTASLQVKLRFDPADCNQEALEINHYDPDVWAAEAVSREFAVHEIEAFLTKHKNMQLLSKKGTWYEATRMLAYNADFDGPRIQNLFKLTGNTYYPGNRRTLCLMQRAAWFYTDFFPLMEQPPNLKLATVFEHLCPGVDLGKLHETAYQDAGALTRSAVAHEALTDVLASLEVHKALRRLELEGR
jgi:hypothetical protein